MRNVKEELDLLKSLKNDDVKQAIGNIESALWEGDTYEKYFNKMMKAYKELLPIVYKDKEIELNKKYWVTEWSWSPICDGRGVYEEIIRDHAVVNDIDCYFTNKNCRVYFKEDIYENKEDAERACKWQNSFGYKYETNISRKNDVNIHFDSWCHWHISE